MRSFHGLFALAVVVPLALFACSSSSSSSDPPPSSDGGFEGGDGAPGDGEKDAGTDATRDATADSGPTAKYYSGIADKSCAEACLAIGKTCTPSCTVARSCGAHDQKDPPYAGSACYYRQSGGTRFNQGRSLLGCDEVVTTTWSYNFSTYTLGDYLGNEPASCCCQ
ncbi:hypothetical protein LVJ94_51395 [Pendulispora rubella]|uniref:Uncharacterized protein n=1 Tax=Pendulispora rubella TaxID=2741070 RepID=A0ABZ2L9A4_9BACT